MYLYLVRHGESEGNARKLFFGHTDYPLTQQGREQAWKAAEKLRSVEFDRCCASDLSRAWETAEICLTGRLVTPEKCPSLREQDMGDLEGKTWDEAQAMFGGALEKYLSDWYHRNLPTVESIRDMMARVSACVEEIIRQGRDTLIVAHNGTLTLILWYLGLIGEKELTDMYFQFRFGCYSAVRIDESGADLDGFNM